MSRHMAKHAAVPSDDRLGEMPLLRAAMRFACSLFGLFLVATILAIALLEPYRDYWRDHDLTSSNRLLLAVALVVLLGITLLLRVRGVRNIASRMEGLGNKVDVFVLSATAILMVVQVLSLRSYVFFAGWDSQILTDSAWKLAVDGEFSNLEYYSNYPNNLLLLKVIALCMKASLRLGFTTKTAGCIVFLVFNFVSRFIALWFLYKTPAKNISVFCGLTAWVLGILLIWTSPWVSVVYSDPLVLGIAPVVLMLLLESRRRNVVSAGLFLLFAGVLVGFGYKIKPQMIFMFFAFVLLGLFELIDLARLRKGKKASETACRIAIMTCGVVIAVTIAGLSIRDYREVFDENRAFGPTHYVMMGMNSERPGVYSHSDVEFSRSFATRAERTSGNLKEIKKRLKDLGARGFAGLLLDKLFINYCDGTFCWGSRGTFFDEPYYEADPLFSVTRSLFYEDGKYFQTFLQYEQIVWFLVLSSAIFGLLGSAVKWTAPRKQECPDACERAYLVAFIALVLLMLSAFQLLFEARARYLYAYSTYFVLLAGIGLSCFLAKAAPKERPAEV